MFLKWSYLPEPSQLSSVLTLYTLHIRIPLEKQIQSVMYVLRDLLQGIGLHDWLGKSETHREGIRKGKLPSPGGIFVFLREVSALLLRPFN